jgi:cbb3-type cytochrome c oxidase subunit III
MKKALILSLLPIFAVVILVAARPEVTAQSKGGIVGVYNTQCAKCHAENGKGIESLQPPDFTDAKWQASRTNKQLVTGINNGVGVMPGFKGALKPAQVAALVGYVRAFGRKK